MNGWEWIGTIANWRMLARYIIKTVLILILINICWLLSQPMNVLDHLSIYNVLVPGRLRFGYGELQNSHAVSVSRLNEMFNDHEISAPYADSEYRIGIFGGSGAWGFGMNADQTLAACINQRHIILPDGRLLRAFNLAYPVPSITRDLMLAQDAFHFHLDAAYWFVNAIGLFRPRGINPSSILSDNPSTLLPLLDKYGIQLPQVEIPLRTPNLLGQTLIGERAFLNTWVQEQLYGLYWQQDKIDFNSFAPDLHYHESNEDKNGDDFMLDTKSYSKSEVNADFFVFEAMKAADEVANDAKVRLAFITDPMWSATITESQSYYNEFFPRWFYDEYLRDLSAKAEIYHWTLLDWTNTLPQNAFTDSPFHYTPQAACQLSDKLIAEVKNTYTLK